MFSPNFSSWPPKLLTRPASIDPAIEAILARLEEEVRTKQLRQLLGALIRKDASELVLITCTDQVLLHLTTPDQNRPVESALTAESNSPTDQPREGLTSARHWLARTVSWCHPETRENIPLVQLRLAVAVHSLEYYEQLVDVVCQHLMSLLEHLDEIDNLSEEIGHNYEELNLFYSVGETLSGMLDIQTIGAMILEEALYTIGAGQGLLRLEENKFWSEHAIPAPGIQVIYHQSRRKMENRPLNVTSSGQVSALHRVFLGDSFTPHGFSFDALDIPEEGFQLCSALQVKNEVIGYLCLGEKLNGAWFTSRDAKLLNAVAAQAGLAIANAVLYHDLQTSYQRLESSLESERNQRERAEKIAQENSRLLEITRERVNRDSLTGLYNHGYLQKCLQEQVYRAMAKGEPLAFLLLDLDNFKLFNQTYGHVIGDQLLQEIGKLLGEICRPEDILGRYGGDEFALIMPSTSAPLAKEMAERIHYLMHERGVELSQFGFKDPPADNVLPLESSIGVALCPTDATTTHELVAAADAYMFKAKRAGRNNISMSTHLQAAATQIYTSAYSVYEGLVLAIDRKDNYTKEHSDDVTYHGLLLAEELGLSEDTRRIVRMSCQLHDIGKIAIPTEILCKPGHLSAKELEIMKQHPSMGGLLVQSAPELKETIDGILYHHEFFNGEGYPTGLSGREIPLLGRLIAVVDVYSALRIDRPYRKGWTPERTLAYIHSKAGTHFDPEIVNAFIRCMADKVSLHLS